MNGNGIIVFLQDQLLGSSLASALGLTGAQLLLASTEADVLSLIARHRASAVILDANVEERCAGLLNRIRQRSAEVAILLKPAAQASASHDEIPGIAASLMGTSEALRRVRDYVLKIAVTNCNVLITGETGTGKELVAQALHRFSGRSSRRLVVVNCASIPDGLFESELFGHERGAFTGALATRNGKFQDADGGTLFLDELEELSPAAQAKMLRVIESREVERLGGNTAQRVDVRIVAATNQALPDLVRSGRFRSDLYYRLAVVNVPLPALRERKEDLEILVEHFLARINREFGFQISGVSADALAALREHHWPGNVRELRNVLEAAAIDKQSGQVTRNDLPQWLQLRSPALSGGPSEDRYKLMEALESAAWNKAKAARDLNCSRMTLYRKMAHYGIEGGAPPKKSAVSVSKTRIAGVSSA